MSLTQDTTLGGNCGQTENITINGDLNLNGFTLTLKNVNLIVTGNLNGGGSIVNFCQNNISTVCVLVSVQNNPNLNGLSCSLSYQTFEFTRDYGYQFKVYDIQGKLIMEGITNESTYNELPTQMILIIKVDGFSAQKIYKK